MWTIVLFVLAVHACLSIFTYTDITNIGLGFKLDTTNKMGFLTSQVGDVNHSYLPVSTEFFDVSKTGANITTKSNETLSKTDFVGRFIESIFGFGDIFSKFISTFSRAVFSIHTLAAPFFGETNAWILEGCVDFIVAIGLLQIVTGRSWKTMD